MGDSFTGKVAGIEPLTRHSGVKGPNGKLLACMVLEVAVVFLWGYLMALPPFGMLSAIRKLQVHAGPTTDSRAHLTCRLPTAKRPSRPKSTWNCPKESIKQPGLKC